VQDENEFCEHLSDPGHSHPARWNDDPLRLPLLFLSSTVLAGTAVWKSAGRMRTWSWIVFIAAAVMTGIHFAGKMS
jgi:hypothetical protein